MLASLVPGIGWLFPVAVLMGIGNGVFHPADFAILNANVAPRRLGHAYSSHGIGGNLGYALAPVVSFALGSAFGWRFALAAMGALGLVALGVIATQRALLVSHRAPDAHLQTLKGSAALFLQAPIVLCFLYFVFNTIGGLGLQTFIPTVLELGLRRRPGAGDLRADRVPAGRHRGNPRRRIPGRADRAARSGRGHRDGAGRRACLSSSRRPGSRRRCCCRCSRSSGLRSAPPARRAT